MKSKIAPWILSIIIFLIAGEFTARIVLSVQAKSWKVMMGPAKAVLMYYPELNDIHDSPSSMNNDTVDVLLLGGSVINGGFGPIAVDIEENLAAKYGCEINMVNLAQPAHTSLDSRTKYDLLKNKNYDIILIYHGINELRFNNCSASSFRSNYSHVSYYRIIQNITAGAGQYSALWTLVYRAYVGTVQLIFPKMILDKERVSAHSDGDNIKTTSSLITNVRWLIDSGVAHGSRVIFCSFANYIPQHYSAEAMRTKDIDYKNPAFTINMWGEADHIKKGLAVHNRALKHLYSASYSTDKAVYFVDMNDSIPKYGEYFNDACHLSISGCHQFVESVLPALYMACETSNSCSEKRTSLRKLPK